MLKIKNKQASKLRKSIKQAKPFKKSQAKLVNKPKTGNRFFFKKIMLKKVSNKKNRRFAKKSLKVPQNREQASERASQPSQTSHMRARQRKKAKQKQAKQAKPNKSNKASKQSKPMQVS